APMKKLFLFIFSISAVFSAHSQDLTDAVRYGTEGISGSARFSAMSGAFGALGGDLSAIRINPAGSAVFLGSTSTISLGVSNNDNSSRFMNGLVESSESEFDLNQAGAV